MLVADTSGHDKHIRRFGETAEGVKRHFLLIERHVGGHLAVIFKVGAARIEYFDRAAGLGGALTLRMAECGKGKNGERRSRILEENAR